MDDRRLGLSLRALRRRRRWRQDDLAAAAAVSQTHISRIEAGRIDHVTIATLRAVVAALDASVVLSVSWQGAALDRLLDERHAALVEACVRLLDRRGWRVEVEVSYSRYGERGSIDVLAVRPDAHVALMVEVKSELAAIEGTLRPIDAKARLAPSIVFERYGWRPSLVGRLLILPEGSSPRRQVDRHAATLTAAFPMRSRALRRWLDDPAGPFAGLAFLPATPSAGGKWNIPTPRRVRKPAAPGSERGNGGLMRKTGPTGALRPATRIRGDNPSPMRG